MPVGWMNGWSGWSITDEWARNGRRCASMGWRPGRRALTTECQPSRRTSPRSCRRSAEAFAQRPRNFWPKPLIVRFLTRDALFVLGGSPRITELMEEARTLADGLEDRRRLIEVLLYQSGTHWSEGRNQNALGLAEEALELAEAADDRQLSGVRKLPAGHSCGL